MSRQRLAVALPFLLVLLTAALAVRGRGAWPLDIDEAAHYLNAQKIANPLAAGDLGGVVRAWTREQGTIAPLGPGVTAVALAIGIPPVAAGTFIVLAAALILLVATRRLQRLASPSAQLDLTTMFVASSAGVALFLTVLSFALPSASGTTSRATATATAPAALPTTTPTASSTGSPCAAGRSSPTSAGPRAPLCCCWPRWR